MPRRTFKRARKPAVVIKAPKTWRTHLGNALVRGGTSGLKALKDALGLNTENKNWDTTIAATSTNTIASMSQPLSGLAQGNTNTTRNGNGLRITHLKTQGILYGNALNNDQQVVRIIVTLQPKVTTAGDYISASELLESPSDWKSPYNTNLNNCKIIHDKLYHIVPTVSGMTSSVPFKIKWHPSYDLGHVQWTDADTTGNVANQLQGLLRYWVITDAAANRPSVQGYTRVHYVDN